MTGGKQPGFRSCSSLDGSGSGSGRKKVPDRQCGNKEVGKDGEAAAAGVLVGVPDRVGKQGKGDPPQSGGGGGPVIWRSNVKIEDSAAAASQDGHTDPAAAAAAPAAAPGGGGDVSMDQRNSECAMCGDMGFVEELRQCALCQFRWQHLYCCVQPNPQGVLVSATGGSPTPFLCDWCRLAKPPIPLPPPSPQKHKQQQQKTSGAATPRAHNVYRPRIMAEKSSRNGKDTTWLRDIPEGSSASEGSEAMEFLVQAALDEEAKQQVKVKQGGVADGLDCASNDVPGSDYSACDTISSTSTIDSVKGPRSSSHRHASRPSAPGDTISSSSSHEGRRRGLHHPEPPPSKFRDVNAHDSPDARRPAKDSTPSRSPGLNRGSTSNDRSSAAAAPLPGPATPHRAPSNGNNNGAGTGTAAGGAGALIWMPPVKLMRGFKKTNHVVANRAPSLSPSPRGPLHRSESLKNLSDRKVAPRDREAVLQRSESLKSSMTRRKHKVLGDINSVAHPAATTPTTPPAALTRTSDGDNSFSTQLPSLKRMKISSNNSNVEPAAPKGLVRRYKSLSDISC